MPKVLSVTSPKNLSRDSNYIVDVVIRPKVGNSSISMREVTITSFLTFRGKTGGRGTFYPPS